MVDGQKYSGETLEKWVLLSAITSSFVGGGVGHATASVGGSILKAPVTAVGLIAVLWMTARMIDSGYTRLENND